MRMRTDIEHISCGLEAGICFRPSEVIGAEALIARREFDRPIVGPEQAIGWIAYRNLDNFRSLGKIDLRGKRYYGARYDSDYGTIRPEKELFEALVEGRIKGYRRFEEKIGNFRKWKELTLTDRMDLKSIWDASSIWFFRSQLNGGLAVSVRDF